MLGINYLLCADKSTPGFLTSASRPSSVVSHPNTGHQASIDKLPALAGWYNQLVFLSCKIWQELFFEVLRELYFFEKISGKYFFLNRGAETENTEMGPMPPFWSEKRSPLNF